MARAKATDLLSSEAQKVLAACLREHLPAAAIVARIKGRDGRGRSREGRSGGARRNGTRRPNVAGADASRWKICWRRRARAITTASEMVNALAMEQLMRDPEGSLTLDPHRAAADVDSRGKGSPRREAPGVERARGSAERIEISTAPGATAAARDRRGRKPSNNARHRARN